MVKFDTMYDLLDTILSAKEIVIFLGDGASIEGKQNGKRFLCFEKLTDTILRDWAPKPAKSKKKRFENFLDIIQKWENEANLSERLHEYLDGEPGLAHYCLVALSIALIGKSNARLYLTTCYDDLISKIFRDLEDNPERPFKILYLSLNPNIKDPDVQEVLASVDGHIKRGHPVVLKLFGDLNSQSLIFKQEDLKFSPEIERKLVEWMRKPMMFIGYSFSDKVIRELLIAAESTSPIFLVNPSKKIPASIKSSRRIRHIKSSFPDFMSALFQIIEEKKPSIREDVEKILSFLRPLTVRPDFQKLLVTIKPYEFPKTEPKMEELEEEVIGFTEPKVQIIPVRKILILAANPMDTTQLRLDEEIREIEEGLKLAKQRDQFEIKPKLAVRLRDLRRALLDYEPQIVHFTGHGNKKGLLVEDEGGMTKRVSAKALAGLFELFSDKIECVILSACYSESQAEAIKKHINYVIGMKKEIKKKAAIEFSVGFYDALGAGRSYKDAFKFGKNAIQSMFPDQTFHLIPVFK